MFKVCTTNLSEDLKDASSDYGLRELGSLSAEDVQAVLEWLQLLDPVKNLEAEPFITIEGATAKVTVRASAGRLYMFDSRAAEQGSREVEIPELLALLAPATSLEQKAAEEEIQVRKQRFNYNQGIALTMLILGLGLNAFTLYSVFYIDTVHRDPPLTLITDQAEARARRDFVTGTFTTGNEPGDRAIVISPDGTLLLQELDSKGRFRRTLNRTYLPGLREGRLHLQLKPQGQIEVQNRDTLLLYGDLYRRKD